MAHDTHDDHSHAHGANCGHQAIEHGDHTDYVHDGHLHRAHDGHVDECSLEASAANPSDCTPAHACGAHEATHTHGPECAHDTVPHAGHVDYLVEGHLHHPHGGHCDDHGAVKKG